jgi:hypothetical protein
MQNTRKLILEILREIQDGTGRAAVDRFASLRDVDNKVSEFLMLLDGSGSV